MKIFNSADQLKNQKGIAHLALIILGVLGIGIGLYLVGTRTNFLPSAQQDAMVTPQTAFHLFVNQNYSLLSNDGKESVVYNELGNSQEIMAPKRNWFYPGEEIRVNVAVSTDIDAANTFAAMVAYPGDLLEATAIIKENPYISFKHSKLESILVELYQKKLSGQSIEEFAKTRMVDLKNGKVRVTVERNTNLSESGWKEYGFEETGRYENLVEGYTVIDSILKLADLADIAYIRTPSRVMTNFDGGNIATDADTITSSLGGFRDQVAEDSMCAQVETRACRYTDPCPPNSYCNAVLRSECKTFPTPCNIPEGWVIEGREGAYTSCNPLQENIQCPQGYYCKQSENCNGDSTACTNVWGGVCYPQPIPNPTMPPTCPMYDMMCIEGTVSTYIGDNNNGCPLYKCLPSPTCRPRPPCLDSEPRCLLPETTDMCPPSPKPTRDYFIQHWLPDTQIYKETPKVLLSGGVVNPGLLTTPPAKPIMATIVFKAKNAGEAELGFTDGSLILRNSDSVNILGNKNGLFISIKDINTSPLEGDLDDDGNVGFKDFSILLSKWGSEDKKADLTRDGKVNIYDFSKLISNWGKNR